MKKLFAILLFSIVSLVTFGQELKPLTGKYVQRQEIANNENCKNCKTLVDAHSLVEYDGIYYTNQNAMIIYENYLIYQMDMAYESTSIDQYIHLEAKTNYIAFWNIKTASFDKMIDLKNIFLEADIKQIMHDKGRTSISISKDGNYLFFGTATNTYMYNLKTDAYSEITPNKGVYSLSPLNEVLDGNKLIFVPMMSYNKHDWFSKMKKEKPSEYDHMLEYNYITKELEIKR